MEPLNFKKLKYIPKHITTLSFLLFYGIVFLLFWGRKSDSLKSDFLLDQMPTFYQYISNFAISYMLYTGIGYFWLMMGVKFRYIIFLGIFFITVNFIYELFIPILNTPDIIDAYFGLAGSLLGFLFLSIVYKYGLKLNPGIE